MNKNTRRVGLTTIVSIALLMGATGTVSGASASASADAGCDNVSWSPDVNGGTWDASASFDAEVRLTELDVGWTGQATGDYSYPSGRFAMTDSAAWPFKLAADADGSTSFVYAGAPGVSMKASASAHALGPLDDPADPPVADADAATATCSAPAGSVPLPDDETLEMILACMERLPEQGCEIKTQAE